MASKDNEVDGNAKVNFVETAFELSLFEQVAFLFAVITGPEPFNRFRLNIILQDYRAIYTLSI